MYMCNLYVYVIYNTCTYDEKIVVMMNYKKKMNESKNIQ